MKKSLIEQSIAEGKAKESWNMIQEYEKEYPHDPEIVMMKSIVAVMINDIEAGLALSQESLRLMPYNPDAYYNYAYVAEVADDVGTAYEYYSRAGEMASLGAEHSFDIEDVNKKLKSLSELITDMAKNNVPDCPNPEYFALSERLKWEHEWSVFHTAVNLIGYRYYDYKCFPPFYVAFAKNSRNSFELGVGAKQTDNTVDSCTELQRITATTTGMQASLDRDYYVPVSAEERCFIDVSNDAGESSSIKIVDQRQFYNFRFPKGNYSIKSDVPLNFGVMVPIGHQEDRKRVVLSIFVDGLAQVVVDDRLRELMPNTYKFFSKGLVCKNAYATGDWTLPCIASAFTGLSSANHKLLHPNRLHKIELTTTMLSESFMNKGYNNTKIGGDWRITPTYGYGRGFNRILYQHNQKGFDIENMISNVVEQLYSMRDTDQFIWLETGDLHVIADEFMIAPLVSEFPVMENGNLNESINSVKQKYDAGKIRYFIEKLKFVDRKLDTLYKYLEDNYSDDELVVTLFSDHGQGFMVKDDDEFLCNARSKIALMARGSGVEGESDEPISLCDYPEILCKLAGLEFNNEFTDSNLPMCFGGDKEREFAITETIHPGDPYRVALHAKDYAFYLNGLEAVKDDCMVVLDEYIATLYDIEGNVLENEKLKDRLTKICLDRIAPNMLYPNE